MSLFILLNQMGYGNVQLNVLGNFTYALIATIQYNRELNLYVPVLQL